MQTDGISSERVLYPYSTTHTHFSPHSGVIGVHFFTMTRFCKCLHVQPTSLATGVMCSVQCVPSVQYAVCVGAAQLHVCFTHSVGWLGAFSKHFCN